MVFPLVDVFIYSFEEGFNSASGTYLGVGTYNYTYCKKSIIAESNNVGKVHQKIHTYQGIQRISANGAKTEVDTVAVFQIMHGWVPPL